VSVFNDRVVKERFIYSGGYSWSTDGANWNAGKPTTTKLNGYVLGMVLGDSGIVATTDQMESIRLTSSLVQDGLSTLQKRYWNSIVDCHGRILVAGYGVYSGPFNALTRESPDTILVKAIACNDSVAIATGNRQDSILVRGPGPWQYSKLPTGTSSIRMTMYSAIWTGHEFVVGGDYSALASSYGNWKDGVGLQWNNEANSGLPQINIYAVALHDSILLLGGSIGEITRAVNWKSWTKIVTKYSQKSLPIYGLMWGKDQFLASSYDSTILSSPDGLIWTVNPLRMDNKSKRVCTPIAYGAGRYFLGTWDSLVGMSTDGKTWESLGKLPSGLTSLLVSNGTLIAMGGNGLIATRIVDSAAVGLERPIERKPMLMRRDGGYVIPVPQDVLEAQLLTYDGRVCESIPSRNGELFVRSQGRTGRFLLSWKEGASGKRMALSLVLMGR